MSLASYLVWFEIMFASEIRDSSKGDIVSGCLDITSDRALISPEVSDLVSSASEFGVTGSVILGL